MFKILSCFDSNHCLAVTLCLTGQRGHNSHRNSIYDDVAQILFKLYLLQYYFPPSSGLKFNSKVEVFRYLDNAQNKVSIQKISPNVCQENSSFDCIILCLISIGLHNLCGEILLFKQSRL